MENANARLNAYLAVITPAAFTQALQSLEYNSNAALLEFENFLDRPNFVPIVIGYVGDSLIQLIPEPHQLKPHNLIEDLAPDIDIRRSAVSVSVLGLWHNDASYRAGQHSDEDFVSDDPAPAHGSCAPIPRDYPPA